MLITPQQKDILDSLIVERLRDNIDNVALVRTFNNAKNRTLTNIIQRESTIDRDDSGATAYYVVKTQKGDLLLYFSLKCGELFEDLDWQRLELAGKTRDALTIVLKAQNTEDEKYKEAEQFIKDNIDAIKNLLPDIDYFLKKKGQYNKELQKEMNSKMQRVLRTCPAIEVVEFCSNDNARDAWKELNLPPNKRMGECVFWYYIVPILQRVQEMVGCQYVYLFAADKSYDGNLINYYKTKLKFEQSNSFGANKPQYDFACIFLCQELNKLIKERGNFFANFNSIEEDSKDII